MNSAAEIWANVLPLLKSELTETAISTWFSGVTALAFEGNQLVLAHPESFKANIIRTRYIELLKKISETDENRVVRIHAKGAIKATIS